MNFLVVDDESGKRERVVELLRTLDLGGEIREAKSFQSAMELLEQHHFAWIILDMRLTSFDVSGADDGGRPRNLGGDEVLRKMVRRGFQAKVIVLTQYSVFREASGVHTLSSFEQELRRKYPSIFHSLIQFQHSNDDWKTRLMHAIEGGSAP